MPAILTLALVAMLSGANDLTALFRWGRRLPPDALFLLGLDRAPCHATDHDFFRVLDESATEQVLGARARWAAVGGHDGGGGVHLVAASASRLGGVIGQLRAAPEADEITAALTLRKGLIGE